MVSFSIDRPVPRALVYFALFNVVLGLLPFAILWGTERALKHPLGLRELTGKGELLLTATTVIAAGIGALVRSRTAPRGTVSIIVYAVALIGALVCVAGYSAARHLSTADSYDPAFVGAASTWIWIAAVVVGGFCVTLASWAEEE